MTGGTDIQPGGGTDPPGPDDPADGGPVGGPAGVARMVGFGPKQAWLAVRDGARGTVAAFLGLRDLGPVPWRDGVDLAYLTDDRLVITPLLPGARGSTWLLVAGRWLLAAPAGRVDVAAMSAALDAEVQAFHTYRTDEAHGWRRAVGGSLVRAFELLGTAGEVTAWFGDPDPAELAIGLPPTLAPGADVLVSENEVLRLAAAWSVDPSSLDGRPAPGPLWATATG